MFKVGWANLSCLPEHNPIVSWGKSIYVTMFCLMQFWGRQFLKWSISIPFAMASSQEWAGPSNEWSMTKVKRLGPRLGFKETMASILWCPLTLFCSEGSQLPYCNLLYRENVCPQPTASKDLKPVKASQEISEAYPSQVSLQMTQTQPTLWLQPCEKYWARSTQLNCMWVPAAQKLWDNTCMLFQPVKFEHDLLQGKS